jgi:cytochrome c
MARRLTAGLALAVMTVWASQAIAADVARGKLVYGECFGCHGIGPRASVKVGPPLNGLLGRRWASYPGYDYSAGLRAGGAAGKHWTVALLNAWLIDPRHLVPGTKMGFAGLPSARDRADVIAYLDQFNGSGHKK